MVPFFVYWAEYNDDARVSPTLTVAVSPPRAGEQPMPTRARLVTEALTSERMSDIRAGELDTVPLTEWRPPTLTRFERAKVYYTPAQLQGRARLRDYYAWIMTTSDVDTPCACTGGTARCTIAAPGCANRHCLRGVGGAVAAGMPCANVLVCSCRRGGGERKLSRLSKRQLHTLDGTFCLLATVYAAVVQRETGRGAFADPTAIVLECAKRYETSLLSCTTAFDGFMAAKGDTDAMRSRALAALERLDWRNNDDARADDTDPVMRGLHWRMIKAIVVHQERFKVLLDSAHGCTVQRGAARALEAVR